MAKLKNIDLIWTAPEGKSVTIGNNRTITRETRADGATVFIGRLHGSPVFGAIPLADGGVLSVRLDACGYLTATTISAMGDFLEAFGIRGRASRAGGVLSARWFHAGEWHERESACGDVVTFWADRYPATEPA